jgi:hypothetical protein
MNIQTLATIIEDTNKALYKAPLPDVEGIHLRYYDSSFWLLQWEEEILINSVVDSLEDDLGAYTLAQMKEMLAKRFAKVYAEKLVNRLLENCNEPF